MSRGGFGCRQPVAIAIALLGLLLIVPCARAAAADWMASEWSECPVLCGGGIQTRTFVCQSAMGIVVEDSACTHLRPNAEQNCNSNYCVPPLTLSTSCNKQYLQGCEAYDAQGGDVSFIVFAVYNLPNKDKGSLGAGTTDPYFNIVVGNTSSSSSMVLNNENAVWGSDGAGEEVHLGWFESGLPVVVEVWNSNGGFLGPDTLVGSFASNIPACNMFVGDVCQERTRTLLLDGQPCFRDLDLATPFTKRVCVEIGYRVRPFKVNLLSAYHPSSTPGDPTSISLGIANDWIGETTLPISGIWSGDGTSSFDTTHAGFSNALGGYLIKTRASEAVQNVSSYLSFSASADATVFVFRPSSDVIAYPHPLWLRTFSTSPPSSFTILFDDEHSFVGYRKFVRKGGVVSLPGNTYGFKGTLPPSTLPRPYVVVVRMVSDSVPLRVDLIKLDKSALATVLWQFAFLTLPLFWMVLPFWKRLSYRLDLFPAYIMSLSFPANTDPAAVCLAASMGLAGASPPNPHLIATLLSSYMKTPTNHEWHQRVWYMALAVRVVVAAPFVIMFELGCVAVVTVRPVTCGYGILFVLFALFALTWAARVSTSHGSRVTQTCACIIAGVVVSLLFYNVLVVFQDPKPFSLFAATCAFLTMNFFLLVPVVLIKRGGMPLAVVHASATVDDSVGATSPAAHVRHFSECKMEDADVLLETEPLLPVGVCIGGLDGGVDATHVSGLGAPAHPLPDARVPVTALLPGLVTLPEVSTHRMFACADGVFACISTASASTNLLALLYGLSVGVLVVLCMAVWVNDKAFPNQGLFILLVITASDASLFMLWRVNILWSACKTSLFLLAIRVCLATFVGGLWFVGLSVVYLLIASMVAAFYVSRAFPRLSWDETVMAVHLGLFKKQPPEVSELSRSPAIILAGATFLYALVLIGCIVDEQESTPKLLITGGSYPTWMFGVATLCLAVLFPCALAVVLAFQCSPVVQPAGADAQDQPLSNYLGFRWLFGPYVILLTTCVIAGLCGVLLFGVTGSAFQLLLGLFIVPVLALGVSVLRHWVDHDFELLEDSSLRPKRSISEILSNRYLHGLDRTVSTSNMLFERSSSQHSLGNDEVLHFHMESSTQSPTHASDSTPSKHGSHLPLNVAVRAAMRFTAARPVRVNMAEPGLPGHVDESLLQHHRADLKLFGDPSGVIGVDKTTLKLTVKDVLGGQDMAEGGVIVPDMTLVEHDGRVVHSRLTLLGLAHQLQLWDSSAVDPKDMPPLQAYVKRCLTPADYVVVHKLSAFCILVLLLGFALGMTSTPGWIGHALWVGTFVLLTSIPPIVQFFVKYTVTTYMVYSMKFSAGLFTVSCFGFLAFTLKGDPSNVDSLWLVVIWLFYPALLALCTSIFYWFDNGFQLTAHLRKACFASIVPVFVWLLCMGGLGGPIAGVVAFLFVLIVVVLLVGAYSWYKHEYFLPHSFIWGCNASLVVLATLCVFAAAVISGQIFPALTMAMFFLALRQAGYAALAWYNRPQRTPMAFSPYLFPMYSYQPGTKDLLCENEVGFLVGSVVLIVYCWAVLAVVAVNDLGVGVSTMSALLCLGLVSYCSLVFRNAVVLDRASVFLNKELTDCAIECTERVFNERRKELDLTCVEFVQRDQSLSLTVDASPVGSVSFVSTGTRRRTVAQLVNLISDTERVLKANDLGTRTGASASSAVRSGGNTDPQIDLPVVAFGEAGTGSVSPQWHGSTPLPLNSSASAKCSTVGSQVAPNLHRKLFDVRVLLVSGVRFALHSTVRFFTGVEHNADLPFTFQNALWDLWVDGVGPFSVLSCYGRLCGWLSAVNSCCQALSQAAATIRQPKAKPVQSPSSLAFDDLGVSPANSDCVGSDKFVESRRLLSNSARLAPLTADIDVCVPPVLVSVESPVVVPVGGILLVRASASASGGSQAGSASATVDVGSLRDPSFPTVPVPAPTSLTASVSTVVNRDFAPPSTSESTPAISSPTQTVAGIRTPNLATAVPDFSTTPFQPRPAKTYAVQQPHDPIAAQRLLLVLQSELGREFYEERRALLYATLLLQNHTVAQQTTAQVMLYRFLHESRFALMAGGFSVPLNAVRNRTVDLHVLANWLYTLSDGQRAAFATMKVSFLRDANKAHAARVVEDHQSAARSLRRLEEVRLRERIMLKQHTKDTQVRRMLRARAGKELRPGELEQDVNDQEKLKEIEEDYVNCQNGAAYGRFKQFFDPEFKQTPNSIGPVECADDVRGWRCANTLNPGGHLFFDGTDPEDIYQGKLADGWFLSALAILAASGGIGDCLVDPLIDNLFVSKTKSSTGVYAIRLFKNAQWETVMVDDFFPVLDTAATWKKTRGVAFAYSSHFEECWVALLEKAYAKYHGGYSSMEYGYVHHALRDLTGGDAEEVFMSQASRGANEASLWANMLQYRRNNYLLGAGTVMPLAEDREVTESGLVFGAAYTVLDVQVVDGHRLVHLRNPPGEFGEWQGDWSDSSSRWTQRIKRRLKWVQADDGMFWMSFPDFCTSFRSIYVCRWCDPKKWVSSVHSGWWRGPTAQGLPTSHNPVCQLEKNPQFQLVVRRPTDVCIIVTQMAPNLVMSLQPNPIVAYLVANAPGRSADQSIGTSSLIPNKVKGVLVPLVTKPAGGSASRRGKRPPPPSTAPPPTPGMLLHQFASATSLGKELTTQADYYATHASRVYSLTSLNVIASTGRPIRQRELRLYASLPPGAYTLLLACYQKGMEGPFTLTVNSNCAVQTSSLWPPAQVDAASSLTCAGRLVHWFTSKADVARACRKRLLRPARPHPVDIIVETGEELVVETEEQQAELAWEAIRQAQAEAEGGRIGMRALSESPWMQYFDLHYKRPYFVHSETGESQFDRPSPEKSRGASGGPGSSTRELGTALGLRARSAKLVGATRVTLAKCGLCFCTTAKGTKADVLVDWCAGDRNPRELLVCVRGCGNTVHPVCAGFSDALPPEPTWTCDRCFMLSSDSDEGGGKEDM